MLRTRDQFLSMLGYEVDKMSDKVRSRTAQRIVNRCAEVGRRLDQVAVPGTKGFRYVDAQIKAMIQSQTVEPKAA